MTSGDTFPSRFTEIDDQTRPDHAHLTSDDHCYFIGEYTARRGYAWSSTNQLILNFKKTPDRRGKPEWRYKELAIREAAAAFRKALNPDVLDRWAFVPVPPSKAREHPLYDDRLTRMLHAIRSGRPLDVRELIVQTESTDAVHGNDDRPRPEEIEAFCRIEETLAEPAPRFIAVVDDLADHGCTLQGGEVAAARPLSRRCDSRAVHRPESTGHHRPRGTPR